MDSRTFRYLVLGVFMSLLTEPAGNVWATSQLHLLQPNKKQLDDFNQLAEDLRASKFKAPYYGAIMVMPFTNLGRDDFPYNVSLKWALLSSMLSDLSYISTMSPWPLWMIPKQ